MASIATEKFLRKLDQKFCNPLHNIRWKKNVDCIEQWRTLHLSQVSTQEVINKFTFLRDPASLRQEQHKLLHSDHIHFAKALHQVSSVRHYSASYTSCECKSAIQLINPLNAELNPICHLLALLEAHHILHVSRIRVKRRIKSHLPSAGIIRSSLYSPR